MADKPLIILGSSRRESDTGKLVQRLFPGDAAHKVNLLDYTIRHYNYDGLYPPDDDFMNLVELMLQHQKIVFATPVYWYAMSGLMKVYFDRLTDIVTFDKVSGRKMKDKETFLLAVGAEEELPQGFEIPFKLTSAYFGMEFKACMYCRTSEIYVKDYTGGAFMQSLASPTNIQ